MISIRKLIGNERKYCTHCGDRAYYELNYLNPKIIQQSSCGVLCDRCMPKLRKAILKATSYKPKITKPKLPTIEDCYKVMPMPEDPKEAAFFAAGLCEMHKFISGNYTKPEKKDSL